MSYDISSAKAYVKVQFAFEGCAEQLGFGRSDEAWLGLQGQLLW